MKERHLKGRPMTIEGEADEGTGKFMRHVSMRVNICQEETQTMA